MAAAEKGEGDGGGDGREELHRDREQALVLKLTSSQPIEIRTFKMSYIYHFGPKVSKSLTFL